MKIIVILSVPSSPPTSRSSFKFLIDGFDDDDNDDDEGKVLKPYDFTDNEQYLKVFFLLFLVTSSTALTTELNTMFVVMENLPNSSFFFLVVSFLLFCIYLHTLHTDPLVVFFSSFFHLLLLCR